MYVEDLRPLKRPKLGFPDFYPQDKHQKEDELTYHNLNAGIRHQPAFDDETGSAINEVQLLKSQDMSQRINSIVEAKKRSAWGQDSQKKKNNLTRENFWPVPVGRNKKENASNWFQELAGTEPLDHLIRKKVPIFNKREEIFDVLFEKNVPVFRAVWYIKMTAAYNSLGAESKLTKKKQIIDPSFEWTVSLTKFMMESAWRICNSSSMRHDSVSSQNSSTDSAELSRWKYLADLSSWLYQENLLDRQEFLRWLIDRIETSKPSDDRSLVLYLPMALKYIKEISECVYLARPLVSFCCQKFSHLYDMQQRVSLFPLQHPKKQSIKEPKSIGTGLEPMETNEDDDVFSSSVHQRGDESGDSTTSKSGSEQTSQSSVAGRKRSKSGSLTVNIEGVSNTDNKSGDSQEDGNKDAKSQDACKHHASLLLQLSCIIQLMAVQCPTAYIHVSLTGKGSSRDIIPKASTPLDKLPLKLSEMPLPKKGMDGILRKIRSSLGSVDHEIRKRAKAAESGWLAMTISDLRTSEKGSIVERVLSVLHQLDTHSFTTCKYHSPLTSLFVKIVQTLKAEMTFQYYEPICMLLCQWAITPYRHGIQRPLAAARLLYQIQTQIQQRRSSSHLFDLDALDESWEQPNSSFPNDASAFMFQQTLFQFLDTRAPVPHSLHNPLKSSEPFSLLMVLFSELIYLGVFSYPLYLSTLIAKGEAKSPIVPQLPFFRGEEEAPPDSPMESDEEELSLTISLPALPGLTFGNHSPQKKLHIKLEEEERTISPSLPDRFGSQDNLLDPFDTISEPLISTEDALNHTCIKTEDNSSMFEIQAVREQQLKSLAELAMPDPLEESSTQLVEFDSQPSSPKTDMFGFYQAFSSPTLDDASLLASSTTTKSKRLDKHASRHLLFASYFSVAPSKLSKQERIVVLCGTGRMRLEVESTVSEISRKAREIFSVLYNENSLVLPSNIFEFMKRFRMLPNFNQNDIASDCAASILTQLSSSTHPSYPSCSQLVFVCTLLEISGSFRQLMELLVELVSFTGEKKEDKRQSFRLPNILCLPIVNLLWHYFPILLLSLSDTSFVYEGFHRVLEGNQKPPKSSSQRAVLAFLQHLHTNCLYIKRTYPNLSSPFTDYMYCVPRVEELPWPTGSLPSLISGCRYNSLYSSGNAVESEKHVNQLTGFLQTSPKYSFCFVCEVLQIVTQKQTNLHTLSVLAYTCAEVGCVIDRVVHELLGGLRALCIPSTVYKACQTGYSQLTANANILKNPSIHGNVITMIGLLLSFNCFTIQDIITYIIKPIFKVYLLYPQEQSRVHGSNAQHGSVSLGFVSLLLRHILVDEYIKGEHSKERENCGIVYPSFVQHFLLAKSQQLSFDTILNLLKELLKLCKDTLRSSRGTTISSKTGMSILVESFSSGSERNEEALLKLRHTLELIACQKWVREQSSQQAASQLLEADKLGDGLSPPHVQYLLHLLIPYSTEDTSKSVTKPDGSLPPHMMDQIIAMERIFKKLDQWTLRNANLHLDIIIHQNANHSHGATPIDHLAQCVIQAFEDSCGDEWVGQTIETGDNNEQVADGAHSPSIWLVTPLISKLPKPILGRILKSAGNVLGRGQWWNQDKSQERKRSTRTSSITSPIRTSLQWQQPFLELILACMNSHHSNHEELLGPLQKQLHTFLTAFEKEGFPVDEQCKSMMYAALKLRLSLVGSMLVTVCSSESGILEWVSLLVQLICSGSVDRQPDNCELFTNCLDMLNALLQTLTHDFHMCMMSGGEDGKKTHTTCIKKMKADLLASKSTCKQEIQQLFPLPQKAYEVTIVKPPSFTQHGRSSDKVQGLRVQETKEISPWEIIEGTRHSGPLQLSWFGAMRTKRKPLRFVEQRRIVRFHTHHKEMEHMTASPYFVCISQAASTTPTGLDQSQTIAVGQQAASGADGTVSSSVPENRLSSSTSQDDRNAAQGIGEKKTEILKTIKIMNMSRDTRTNIPQPIAPLPPSIQPQPSIQHNPMIQQSMRARIMVQARGAVHPGAQQQQQQQRMYRQSWFDLLTPEQKNQISTMSPDEKHMYFLNLKRKYEQQQHHPAMQHQPMGYRHPMPGPRIVNPNPMQAIHGQPPRPMVHSMYSHPSHGQMGPPSNHPSQGFMIPGQHHPGQPMYRQGMHPYGPAGMHPQHQHNMMPFHQR